MVRTIDRVAVVWAVLVAATAVSWSLGHETGTGVTILVVAFGKVWLIGANFMEVRDAPATLRFLFGAYCAIACGILVALLLRPV